MDQTYKISNSKIKKWFNYTKQRWDKEKKVGSVEITPGDRVLMRNVRVRGDTGNLKSFGE